jgi:hypothetical protein
MVCLLAEQWPCACAYASNLDIGALRILKPISFPAQCSVSCAAPTNTNLFNSGVERRMEICHQQPHLVPPMRLVVYDKLPSPGGMNQRPSTASRLIADGKHMASRSVDRAVRSIKSRTSSRISRPSISAPSDFVHLNQPRPPRRVPSFRPLVLSIHIPGNHLPELPEFTKFDFEELGLLTPPPRALASPFGHARDGSTDSSFRFPRKPVGSEPGRSLSRGSTRTLSHMDRRESLPESIIIRPDKSFLTYADIQPRRQDDGFVHNQATIPEETAVPSPKHSSTISSLPSLIGGQQQRYSPDESPDLTPPMSPAQPTPPRSRSVAQWLLQNSSATPSPAQPFFPVHSLDHFRSRSRTLSGSTLSSANPSTFGRTTSLSSAVTTVPPYSPPPLPEITDKQLEASALLPPCPTLYEGKQQHYVTDPVYQRHQRRAPGNIGVAF